MAKRAQGTFLNTGSSDGPVLGAAARGYEPARAASSIASIQVRARMFRHLQDRYTVGELEVGLGAEHVRVAHCSILAYATGLDKPGSHCPVGGHSRTLAHGSVLLLGQLASITSIPVVAALTLVGERTTFAE